MVITSASEKDYPVIIEIWELSLRATHHFLNEDYLQEIKALLPAILAVVPVYTWLNDQETIKGFAGVADQKIEMLFVHPDEMGKGTGEALTDFYIQALKADKVDVNEQNEAAIRFYKKMGIIQTGRQDLDSLGRPCPLVQMEHKGQ